MTTDDDWDAAAPVKWTQAEAIELCVKINDTFTNEPGGDSIFGRRTQYHVALTGGTLYRPGARKDVDIVVYGADHRTEMNKTELSALFKEAGLEMGMDYGRVWKALYNGKPVDFLFPLCAHKPGQPTYMELTSDA